MMRLICCIALAFATVLGGGLRRPAHHARAASTLVDAAARERRAAQLEVSNRRGDVGGYALVDVEAEASNADEGDADALSDAAHEQLTTSVVLTGRRLSGPRRDEVFVDPSRFAVGSRLARGPPVLVRASS